MSSRGPQREPAPGQSDLAARLLSLYTGAVADVLDSLGFDNQILPATIMPVTMGMKVAGPAFTAHGAPSTTRDIHSMRQLLAVLEGIEPGSVCVMSCGGDDRAAQWGEIMSRAVMEQGCVGAVLDGGIRDTETILQLGFAVFCRLRSPASSIGRWQIKEWHVPVRIGGVDIRPGDWILGDIDGVVVVPAGELEQVVTLAEQKARSEGAMREELARGRSITSVYDEYGQI